MSYWWPGGGSGGAGPPGADGTFIESWEGSWVLGSYDAGDLVEHQGSSWLATVAITSEEPGIDPEWELVAQAGDPGPGVPVGGEGNTVLQKVDATDHNTAWRKYPVFTGAIYPEGSQAFATWHPGTLLNNDLVSWEERGGTIATPVVTGTATVTGGVAGPRAAVTPLSTLNMQLNGGASGGTAALEYTGPSGIIDTASHARWIPYFALRAGDMAGITNIKAEVLETDGVTWVTMYDGPLLPLALGNIGQIADAPIHTITPHVWVSPSVSFTNFPARGARFTFTLSANGVAFIKELGIRNPNRNYGGWWLPGKTVANTWLSKQTFSGEIEVDGTLNHDGSTAGFYGVTPVVRPTALTTSDPSTIDTTYGTEEANVISNLRTRLNELETKLRALGLLT